MDSILNKIQELLIEKGIEEVERKAFIQQLQAELKGKKYGLVWENKIEKVSEQLKTHIPYLTEVEEKRLTASPEDETHHLLIEGDNLEAVTLLQTTHKGGVNVCCIDPPYNRGKNDFIYNDVFVDQEDSYRHSKWLSFMQKRLLLAYELLADNGVVFINIGEDEFARLNLLCQEIFGKDNVEIIIWNKISDEGSAGQGKMKVTHRFRLDHEYVIVAYKDKSVTKFNKPLMKKEFKNEYKNIDDDIRGDWISCELCKSEAKSKVGGKNYYSITTPSGRVLSRQWHFSETEFYELDADNRIYWGNGNIIPRLKKFVNEQHPITPTSIISGITQTDGENDLLDIFKKKVFSYPKPVELIKWLLKIGSDKNDLILDFFAGSGTTGQAVIELNNEDGGNRRCILCTNNEVSEDKQKKYFCLNSDQLKEYSQTEEYEKRVREPKFQSLGICQAVTYKRLEAVINGYASYQGKDIAGLPANLHYYKINTIPKVNNSTDNAAEYLTKGIEIIGIKENAFNREDFKEYCILSNKDKVILVYLEPFVLGHEVIEISKKLKGYEQSQKIIYSTMTDVVVHGVEVKEYPQEILEQINRIQEILKQWEDETGE